MTSHFKPNKPENKVDALIADVCNPKYLEGAETHRDAMARIASHLKDNDEHFNAIKTLLREQAFLPAGRVQASAGAARQTTAFNCFVSGTIHDSRMGIFQRLGEAAETMGLGGGDGFDFSPIRPRRALIKSQGSGASGPVSYMRVWDTMCATIASAGNRRGAMMATLDVSHPDIEEFIDAKRTAGELTNFNISVLVSDAFIQAVKNDENWDLVFDGQVYKTVRAQYLWEKIMRSTWSHAEPGVLFIDTINRKNNLYYCEYISATNPCGEQPLPPNGACLLGSINLTKYIVYQQQTNTWVFAYDKLSADIPHIVRMMDNIVDRTIYPLAEQEAEAKSKRRMGLGYTGVANACERMGMPYGSKSMLAWLDTFGCWFANKIYMASVELAKEKGSFPLYDEEKYMQSEFIQRLSPETQKAIKEHGIRNSHLLSVAPTGTISLFAGNISSGIEPPFLIEYDRRTIMPDGSIEWWPIYDYAYDQWGIRGRTANELSAVEHVDVLTTASRWLDSACSKTCNVGDEVSFDEFKDLYMRAYEGGASGCTTFRSASIETRGEVMKKKEETNDKACEWNPITGSSCAD